MTNREKLKEELSKSILTFEGAGTFYFNGEEIAVFAGVRFDIDKIKENIFDMALKKAPPELMVEYRAGFYIVINECGKVFARKSTPFTLNEIKEYEK